MIRQHMEAQRAALDEKLETLENKILSTVDCAREAVAETVTSVKEGVKDSVDSVKGTVETSMHAVQDTFDLPAQVNRHPWAIFGGAVAAGFVAGCILNRTSTRAPASAATGAVARPAPTAAPTAAPRTAVAWMHPSEEHVPSGPPASRETWADHMARLFAPEFQRLKSLAVGALMGVVREMVSEPLPDPMRPQAKEILDNITTKLGGEVMARETVEPLLPHHRSDEHNGRHNGHQADDRHGDVLDDDRREFGL